MSTARFTGESSEASVPASSDCCTLAKERDGERVVVRLAGIFDRASAWKLRGLIEADSTGELLLDFAHVRDLSDLGLAVLAHGLTQRGGRVLFRGLRQHQIRILRYCGVTMDETSAREAETSPAAWSPTTTPA